MQALPDQPERIAHKRHSRLHRFLIWRFARKAVADTRAFEAAFDMFRAGVTGDYPKAMGKGIILCACNDLYYWRFGITLLLSLAQREPGAPVHLHLWKPSAQTLAPNAENSRALAQVTLTWTIDDCRLATELRFRTVYLAAVRFLIAREVSERTRCPLLCLDVDAIAVRPVWATYDDARSRADIILIQRRERKQATRKILASAVGFNPTPAGLQFVSSVARSLAAAFTISPLYHVDQMLIFYVMREMAARTTLAVADMPGVMADSTFSGEAVFWMPKSWFSGELGGAYFSPSACRARKYSSMS
jgi:hypothetical protein